MGNVVKSSGDQINDMEPICERFTGQAVTINRTPEVTDIRLTPGLFGVPFTVSDRPVTDYATRFSDINILPIMQQNNYV